MSMLGGSIVFVRHSNIRLTCLPLFLYKYLPFHSEISPKTSPPSLHQWILQPSWWYAHLRRNDNFRKMLRKDRVYSKYLLLLLIVVVPRIRLILNVSHCLDSSGHLVLELHQQREDLRLQLTNQTWEEKKVKWRVREEQAACSVIPCREVVLQWNLLIIWTCSIPCREVILLCFSPMVPWTPP